MKEDMKYKNLTYEEYINQLHKLGVKTGWKEDLKILFIGGWRLLNRWFREQRAINKG